MTWYNVVNTMTGSADCYGHVISSHKSLRAAFVAVRKAQPSGNSGAYVPTVITTSERREDRGSYVSRTATRPDPEIEEKEWIDYAWECHQKGRKP